MGPEDLYFGNQDNGSFGTTGGGNAVVTWTNEQCCDGFDTAGERVGNQLLGKEGAIVGMGALGIVDRLVPFKGELVVFLSRRDSRRCHSLSKQGGKEG